MDGLKLEDGSAEDWLKQGQALFEQGDFEGAISCYEKAVEIEPGNAEAWFNHGQVLKELELYEEAVACYDKAIQFRLDFHESWHHRGIALYSSSKYEEAIASYDKALQFKLDDYVAWYNRGRALIDLGHFKEALTSYNQAIHFKSDFYQAWYNRGVRLNDLGHYEEAIANYDEALRLTQYQCWQACVNRGQTILFLQDYKAALANWDQGISALLPTTPNYQYACGELHHRKGRTRITAALKMNFQGLHFTGHSYHNSEEPLQSALALTGQDLLTLKEIFQLKLQPYTLVCLSACETGITSTQDIIDEYVGLVSGFLAAGAAHVISTLWTVEEISSALLMIQFYDLLRNPLSPAKALSEAQQWLKSVTYQELITWYQNQATGFAKIDPGCPIAEILETEAEIAQDYANEKGLDHQPYSHPFHWAGFTLTGKVPSEPYYASLR